MEFDDPAWMAFTTANLEYDTPVLRFGYTSMTTPFSTYDYDMETRERTLLKRTEVVGDFDPCRLPVRAPVGHGARRSGGAGVARLPQSWIRR